MIHFLDINQLLVIHADVLAATGGSAGLRDRGLLESCVAQPQMTFSGQELYPTLADKAAAVGFFLISNHAFIDGNKRVGYVAMRLFLQINGHDLAGSTDEKERTILAVAASEMAQETFFEWVRAHVVPLSDKKPEESD